MCIQPDQAINNLVINEYNKENIHIYNLVYLVFSVPASLSAVSSAGEWLCEFS